MCSSNGRRLLPLLPGLLEPSLGLWPRAVRRTEEGTAERQLGGGAGSDTTHVQPTACVLAPRAP